METELLDAMAVERAAQLLREGGLVGIPTETVYGLGADGLNPAAVKRIFQVKGRPQDNPLILHIPSQDALEQYCREVPPRAYRLAEQFWPGPLTMILRRKELISDVVTAGLDTVGIRCPAHPVCLELLKRAGVPVAAPSGNTSGRPSPTTARAMLEDMAGKIDAVLDGGPCGVGVESTIIDLTVTPPRLLRPGGVTLEQLYAVIGDVAVDGAVSHIMEEWEQPRAPGMKYRHYAPKAPVTVVCGPAGSAAEYILAHAAPRDGILCFEEYAAFFSGRPFYSLGSEADYSEQARRLFESLRYFDATDVPAIWAQCPEATGLGLAVSNRLQKAAGFHIIEVTAC